MSVLVRRFTDLFSRKVVNGKLIPEIDGLRFLAIFLVFLHHVHSFFEYKSTATFTDIDQFEGFRQWLIESRKGVELFFAISGFVLALPFAKSYLQGSNMPSLKKYFMRRLTRLEPPYIAALFMMLIAFMLITPMDFPFAAKSLLTSLVYAHNIVFEQPSYLLAVAWSLELEVHFYLIAPFLFLSLKLPATIRRSGLVIFIAALPFVQAPFETNMYLLIHYIQYFLIGILLADLYVSLGAERTNHWGYTLLGGILFLAVILFPHVRTHHIEQPTDIYWAVAFPFVIGAFYFIVLTNHFWKKVFGLRWISIIGGMCYSIYLMHQPILTFVMRFILQYQTFDSYVAEVLWVSFICIPPVLIGSALFYLAIEKPCMNPNWPSELWAKLAGKRPKDI